MPKEETFNPTLYVEKAWEQSTKTPVACGYIAGTLDTLLELGKITQEEYVKLMDETIYSGRK